MYSIYIPKKGEVKTQKAPKHLLNFDCRWIGEHRYQTSDLLLDKRALREILATRNVCYRRWLKYWRIPNRRIRWQEVRIVTDKVSEHSTTKDYWFNRFIEGCFTVFENPISMQDAQTKKVYQYYLLSPEDCYEVALQLHRDKGIYVPRRHVGGDELFLPKDLELSVPRVVPVEMCKHIRWETSGGTTSYLNREGVYNHQVTDSTPEVKKIEVYQK